MQWCTFRWSPTTLLLRLHCFYPLNLASDKWIRIEYTFLWPEWPYNPTMPSNFHKNCWDFHTNYRQSFLLRVDCPFLRSWLNLHIWLCISLWRNHTFAIFTIHWTQSKSQRKRRISWPWWLGIWDVDWKCDWIIWGQGCLVYL